MEMWRWEAPRASGQADARDIEAREEAVAETAIEKTHAVIGTLQIWMRPRAALEETSTEVVGVPVLAPGRLMVIGTTVQEPALVVMMRTELETEAPAVTAPVVESVLPAPSASRQHLNQRKTSVTEGLSSSSSLLLD